MQQDLTGSRPVPQDKSSKTPQAVRPCRTVLISFRYENCSTRNIPSACSLVPVYN